MYRLEQPVNDEPRASERVSKRRSKHSVFSGKEQVKRSLGEIDTDILPKRSKEDVGGARATSYYRTAQNEYRETMSDVVDDALAQAIGDTVAEEMSSPAEEGPVRPRGKGEGGSLSFGKLAEKVENEANDPAFRESVSRLAEDFNITEQEIYAVINGENRDWSWSTTNDLGYKGLFQIGKTPASEAGIDYSSLTEMKPSEQVAEYRKYLNRWDYDGSVPLAVMQAAPGKAKNLKGKPDSTVIYPVNSTEWKANKPWRSKGGKGPVTLGSLRSYYR